MGPERQILQNLTYKCNIEMLHLHEVERKRAAIGDLCGYGLGGSLCDNEQVWGKMYNVVDIISFTESLYNS